MVDLSWPSLMLYRGAWGAMKGKCRLRIDRTRGEKLKCFMTGDSINESIRSRWALESKNLRSDRHEVNSRFVKEITNNTNALLVAPQQQDLQLVYALLAVCQELQISVRPFITVHCESFALVGRANAVVVRQSRRQLDRS